MHILYTHALYGDFSSFVRLFLQFNGVFDDEIDEQNTETFEIRLVNR